MTNVAIVYHSGYGHTEILAHKAAQGVRDTGAMARLLAIDPKADNYDAILDAVSASDAVIFGTPTYMGDVSAAFKGFEEASSKVFGSGAWKDKLAAGFTVSHSFAGDKGHTIESLATFAAQHGMIWVSLGVPAPAVPAAQRGPDALNRVGGFLGAQAQADNGPADITPPEGDRETVRLLGERVALAAQRWGLGAIQTHHRQAA